MESLVGFGFERTDFVYEPGQFAVRGGILDIYSFGNEKPYRLELFGNEVDSIRIFDPESQLSERRLLQVQIIPNIETHFSTEKKVSLFEFLPENTVIWMHDHRFVREKITILEAELAEFLESASSKEIETAEGTVKKKISAEDFIRSLRLMSYRGRGTWWNLVRFKKQMHLLLNFTHGHNLLLTDDSKG